MLLCGDCHIEGGCMWGDLESTTFDRCGRCGRRLQVTHCDHYNFDLPDPSRPREDAVGTHSPSTSKRAAREARVRAGTQNAKVLAGLHQAGVRGLTAAEAAPLINRSRNQTAARLWQLRKDGWVEYLTDDNNAPVERATDDGEGRFTGQVHIITLAGRLQLEQIGRRP